MSRFHLQLADNYNVSPEDPKDRRGSSRFLLITSLAMLVSICGVALMPPHVPDAAALGLRGVL